MSTALDNEAVANDNDLVSSTTRGPTGQRHNYSCTSLSKILFQSTLFNVGQPNQNIIEQKQESNQATLELIAIVDFTVVVKD